MKTFCPRRPCLPDPLVTTQAGILGVKRENQQGELLVVGSHGDLGYGGKYSVTISWNDADGLAGG